MLVYLLSFLSLFFLAAGLVVLFTFFIRRKSTESKLLVDADYNCLNFDSEQIRTISLKYGNRIRGSVRLSQGRLKSVNEMREKENTIIFP